jgi:hypothetical protein
MSIWVIEYGHLHKTNMGSADHYFTRKPTADELRQFFALCGDEDVVLSDKMIERLASKNVVVIDDPNHESCGAIVCLGEITEWKLDDNKPKGVVRQQALVFELYKQYRNQLNNEYSLGYYETREKAYISKNVDGGGAGMKSDYNGVYTLEVREVWLAVDSREYKIFILGDESL